MIHEVESLKSSEFYGFLKKLYLQGSLSIMNSKAAFILCVTQPIICPFSTHNGYVCSIMIFIYLVE